jgi:hypothetical protein
MSTSSPPANQSMRQQLDELDSLLQRMLNLPINQMEEAGADPTVQRARFSDPSQTPAPPTRRASMMLLDGSAPIPTPQTAPASWDPHWNINLNPQQGSSVFGPRGGTTQRTATADAAAPVWRAETVAVAPPQSEPTPQPPMSAPEYRPESRTAVVASFPRSSVAEPPSIALAPVIAINRMFDAAVIWLGPPGEFLCTRAGRGLLGLGGLALFGGSVAWAAAGWFGWPH